MVFFPLCLRVVRGKNPAFYKRFFFLSFFLFLFFFFFSFFLSPPFATSVSAKAAKTVGSVWEVFSFCIPNSPAAPQLPSEPHRPPKRGEEPAAPWQIPTPPKRHFNPNQQEMIGNPTVNFYTGPDLPRSSGFLLVSTGTLPDMKYLGKFSLWWSCVL